jgi:voltage-gated potassium channel
MTLIFLNAAIVVVDTLPGIPPWAHDAFYAFTVFSIIVFSIEYVLRVWSATVVPKYQRPILGRLRYIVSPMALVDLAAVLPLYLPFGSPHLLALRAIRLFRVMGFLRLIRFVRPVRVLRSVLREKRDELIVSGSLLLVVLVLSSSLMYFVEHEVQPGKFASIPETMWWSIQTITSVGYGDVYPVTSLGKVLGAITALLGVGTFALSTAILTAGFIETWRRHRAGLHICPHCGGSLDEFGAHR